MTGLRKLHLMVGFTLVPFLLITAGTGLYILLSHNYQPLRWHSWFKYGGVVLALGLLFLAVSGGILYTTMRIQQWKRKAKAKAGAAAPKP
jgi:multisubunit Na+/H+ antiporter MnhB subunit